MSTNVSVGFDPYSGWLSIQSEQRPPGAYQWFNLEPLEANPLKINAAIMKQRQALEGFRAGANPRLWESIRAELEAAVVVLTNAEQKAIYDAALQRKAAARSKQSSGQRAVAGPTIACRHCSKANTSDRRFCGGCGHALWDLCGACSAEVPVDENFCGICGSNLQAIVSAELAQARASLDEARIHRAALRYDEALFVLKKLAKNPDYRLDEVIEEGLEELRATEAEIAAHRAAAADALERAQVLLSGFAYDGAVGELLEIHEQFRTSEIKATLADAQERRQEILTLSGDIRAAIEQKRTADLLPKIERLLHLKPGHAPAQKLAFDLRDRLVTSAKKKLLEHRYAEALTQLQSVPSFVRTPEIDKVCEHAEELAWLGEDLRQSPVADATLVGIAERLVKIAPGNTEAAKLKEQLQARLAQPADNARQAYAPWCAAPQRKQANWPVDWLTGSQRLRVPSAAQQDLLAAQPGQFFVALGLALQGLGKAALDMNLAPEAKATVLTQFKSLLRKKAAKPVWGIDLNSSGLRAVQLIAAEQGVTVVEAYSARHRKILSQPDAEQERGAICLETLQAFIARHALGDARVIVNMPAQRLLGRFIDMP
ncbi:MAG TPA: zinc ribbon domain-containing protein, partial [Pirellulaceae bacterium]|nr:zinc ribbon domain-containing protein [Pirellulaceae bacterium]